MTWLQPYLYIKLSVQGEGQVNLLAHLFEHVTCKQQQEVSNDLDCTTMTIALMLVTAYKRSASRDCLMQPAAVRNAQWYSEKSVCPVAWAWATASFSPLTPILHTPQRSVKLAVSVNCLAWFAYTAAWNSTLIVPATTKHFAAQCGTSSVYELPGFVCLHSSVRHLLIMPYQWMNTAIERVSEGGQANGEECIDVENAPEICRCLLEVSVILEWMHEQKTGKGRQAVKKDCMTDDQPTRDVRAAAVRCTASRSMQLNRQPKSMQMNDQGWREGRIKAESPVMWELLQPAVALPDGCWRFL